MDEYNTTSLLSSRDEYVSRFVNLLTPHLIDGIKSIFKESVDICNKQKEPKKYLMTFQNYISRCKKWNAESIERERKRIVEKSGCVYLEDFIACVHIIQLKLLTSVRVGQKQKKIDIAIPKIDDFIGKCYTNISKKLYPAVYLFEIGIDPLTMQKNKREFETMVKESIINTIRDNIPIEPILRAYIDETVEDEYVEEVNEEIVNEKIDQDALNKLVENKTIEKEQLKRQQEDIERLKNEKERELRNNELNEQEQQMLSSSKEFNGMNDDDNSQENISISDASSVLSDLSYDYIDNSEINEEDNTDDDSIPKLKIFDNDVNNNIELEIEEL